MIVSLNVQEKAFKIAQWPSFFPNDFCDILQITYFIFSTMNNGQQEAVTAALAGHSFLLSGLAGVGKSFTTGKVIEALRQLGRHVLVTSSTGMPEGS